MKRLALFAALVLVAACESKKADNTTVDTSKTVITTPVKDTALVETKTTTTVDTVKKTDHVPDAAKKPAKKK